MKCVICILNTIQILGILFPTLNFQKYLANDSSLEYFFPRIFRNTLFLLYTHDLHGQNIPSIGMVL